ncbi:hypothetical protein PoB_004022300 [Plakobranchus ocellatus]|uniref:Uncharacterized protein n=1 Tax=Plakobranchus ocellatus TaxID=259542 RepID=A0AAV4B2B8_9GAST|nr:hypothetical protein PoB_004022300 [Plakobranchus ocellatus]
MRSPLPSLMTLMVSSPRIDFSSLWILKGDLSATFPDPFELITGSPPTTEPNQGNTLRSTPELCKGYPGAILPAEGVGPLPIQRKLNSPLGTVGQRCPPASGEGSGQGGMLMSDSHYCGAVTTSTSRIHPSPHMGHTSRQTRLPHCGGGPLNYSQHWRATVDRSSGQQKEK